jgi:flagellar hook protein FlgE
MMDSIFIGMSGLLASSQGLSNISGNVSNLNTAGYKRFELNYQDVGYQADPGQVADDGASPYTLGAGVSAGTALQVFRQGEFRQTGNDLDAAIDGNGLFVVQRDGELLFTRSGQFAFDGSGILTSREDGAHVRGLRDGRLVDISITGRDTVPPKATRSIAFSDSLSVNDDTFSVGNITAIDSLGVQHTLTLNLTNDKATAPGRWSYTLLESGTELTTGTLHFSGSGTPDADGRTHTFSYAPPDAAAVDLTLDFSKANQFSSSASSLKMDSRDGKTQGLLTKTTIDAKGHLVLAYSNGDTADTDVLALASVQNLQQLRASGDNRFALPAGVAVNYGTAGNGGFGSVKSGNLEASNVDLAQEFGELIIAQRAYQASSQVITAANEMLQQLADLKGHR